MKGLDLRHFKKSHEDHHSATLAHPKGHSITVAKKALSPVMLKQLADLPMASEGTQAFAEGGEALRMDQNTDFSQLQKKPVDWEAINQQQNMFNGELKDPMLPAQPATDATQSPAPMPQQAPQPQAAPQVNSDPFGYAAQGDMLNKGFNAAQAGIQGEAQARGAFGEQEAGMLQKNADQQMETLQNAQKHMQDISQNIEATTQDIKNGHINPNHYLENRDSTTKVLNSIGLILGGMGAGASGENPALQFLNNQIERDVNSQVQNLNNKKTLLGAYQQQYGNLRDATDMTRLTLANVMADQIKMAEAKAQTPIEKARAQQALSSLYQTYAPLMQTMAMRRTALSGAQSGNMDPSMLVPALVPKEHQAKVFDEIDAAKSTAQAGPKIMSAFDNASKTMNATDLVPGTLNRYQKEMHALMGPTFKDVEGTVRQAAMDNAFSNMTPQFGDSDKTIQTKRESLATYLKTKEAASTARGFGIDLRQFPATKFSTGQTTERYDPATKKTALFDSSTKQFLGYK